MEWHLYQNIKEHLSAFYVPIMYFIPNFCARNLQNLIGNFSTRFNLLYLFTRDDTVDTGYPVYVYNYSVLNFVLNFDTSREN